MGATRTDEEVGFLLQVLDLARTGPVEQFRDMLDGGVGLTDLRRLLDHS